MHHYAVLFFHASLCPELAAADLIIDVRWHPEIPEILHLCLLSYLASRGSMCSDNSWIRPCRLLCRLCQHLCFLLQWKADVIKIQAITTSLTKAKFDLGLEISYKNMQIRSNHWHQWDALQYQLEKRENHRTALILCSFENTLTTVDSKAATTGIVTSV